MRRPQIDRAREIEFVSARGLDGAAIATQRATAGGDTAIHLGLFIRPDDDLAAGAGLNRIGVNLCLRADVGQCRVGNRGIAAMSVATDQYRAAAGLTAGIDNGIACETHPVPEHLDIAARTRTGGSGLAACTQQGGVRRLEYDFAVFDGYGAVGADQAKLIDE